MKPMYDFLFVYNSNFVPNLQGIHVTTICNQGQIQGHQTKPTQDFLLVINSSYVPNLHAFCVTTI